VIDIAAVLISLVIVMIQGISQRRSSREERRQQRLADTYVTLTDYVLRERQYSWTAMPSVEADSHCAIRRSQTLRSSHCARGFTPSGVYES